MDLVTNTHLVLDGSLSEAAAVFWAGALAGSWRAAGPGAARDASLVPVDGDTYVHRAGRGRAAPALVLEVDDVEASTRRVRTLGATAAESLRSPAGCRSR